MKRIIATIIILALSLLTWFAWDMTTDLGLLIILLGDALLLTAVWDKDNTATETTK